MVRVRLTPNTAGAGGTREFDVIGFDFDLQSRRLVLKLRDGQMCIEALGSWELSVGLAHGSVPHSIAEAERIHDGRNLVVMAPH